jgi:hypothetical protein
VLGRIPSATVLALATVCVVLLFAQARQSAVWLTRWAEVLSGYALELCEALMQRSRALP